MEKWFSVLLPQGKSEIRKAPGVIMNREELFLHGSVLEQVLEEAREEEKKTNPPLTQQDFRDHLVRTFGEEAVSRIGVFSSAAQEPPLITPDDIVLRLGIDKVLSDGDNITVSLPDSGFPRYVRDIVVAMPQTLRENEALRQEIANLRANGEGDGGWEALPDDVRSALHRFAWGSSVPADHRKIKIWVKEELRRTEGDEASDDDGQEEEF